MRTKQTERETGCMYIRKDVETITESSMISEDAQEKEGKQKTKENKTKGRANIDLNQTRWFLQTTSYPH